MSRALTDIRAFARMVPMNREITLFLTSLTVALVVGGILADAALTGAVAPAFR